MLTNAKFKLTETSHQQPPPDPSPKKTSNII